jgi:hypothetical protein
MRLRSRECIADVANALDLTTAVEVGTHQGVFASQFMKRFRGTISLVDPWEGFTEGFETYYPASDESSRDRNRDMQIAMTAMDPFHCRYSVFRMTSEQASVKFEDESVGIVYIDALHEYEDVSQDIALWYPKVQRGGIISGHDFEFSLQGVIRAVEEFRKKTGLQIHLTDDFMPSWWAIKE